MDEPFGAVDPINRARLQNEFNKIQKRLHKTVVFVTHDIEEALRLGDKIAIMEKGILQSYAAPEEIFLDIQNEFIREFLGKDYVLKLLARYTVNNYTKPLTDTAVEYPLFFSSAASMQEALAGMIETGQSKAVVKDAAGVFCGEISLKAITRLLKRGGAGEAA
jgi:osmoprotectant transport system ATP-binding protein